MYNLFTPTKVVFASYIFSFGVLIKELRSHPDQIKADLIEECYSSINRDVAIDAYGLMKYRWNSNKNLGKQAQITTPQFATLAATLLK